MATYKYDEKTQFVLPSGFEYLTETDDDGDEIKKVVAGKYYNDDGEETYKFTAVINELNVTYEKDSDTLSFKDIAQNMLDGSDRKGGRYFVVPESPQCMFMTIPLPFSIFGVMIKSFGLVMMFQEDRYNVLQFVASSVFNDDEPKENSKIYENMMKLAKSVRVEGEKLPLDQLTAKKLQKALELTFNEDDETIDVSPTINLELNDGKETVTYELTQDGFKEVETERDVYFRTSDEPSKKGKKKGKKKKTVEEDNRILPVDTLRLNDHYEDSLLNQYGKDIKRVVVPDHCYSINYILLSKCPNIEEFIIGKNSDYTFVDGVLYDNSRGKREIKYITKNVKELHIDANVSDIGYWHGVEKVTVDKNNSTFAVQDNMLLSRRKNSLYFVFSKAKEVSIPEGVTSIHYYAFEYCDELKKIVFPASYEWSEWHAPSTAPLFKFSDSVKDPEIIINGTKARYQHHMIVKYPDTSCETVMYFGDTDVCHIPANITSTFGFRHAFYKVKNFEVDPNNQFLVSVDGVILDKTKEILKFYPPARDYFKIPKSVKSIESHSVSDCNNLTEVVLPEHVESVGLMAFASCKNLKTVTKLNPKADINKDAFFGCKLDADKNDEEILDEQALMRELDKEISAIREASRPKEEKREEKRKERIAKSKDIPKKAFQYDDHVSFELPEDFIIAQDTDKDGNKNTEFLWGEYYKEDEKEAQYKFTALIGEMTVNEAKYGNNLDSKVLMDLFVSEAPNGLIGKSYVDFANVPFAFVSAEDPTEVPFGFFGNLVLKNYKVFLGVVSGDRVVYVLSNGYKNEESDEDIEKEDLLFEKMIEIAEGISIDGEKIDLKGLDDGKLRNEIEPLFADSQSTFSLGFNGSDESKEQLPEVRFDENNDRRVIVDNKWSFDLPEGIDLRFNSEHVDLMGKNTTANYVIEGLEYNSRFFFDFELHQRPDTGMDKDLDVLGCRYDNDVSAGNAQQNILVDGDDLFVDIVHKGLFFFRSMVILRVRGEELRPWDFQIGLSATDQDMIGRWDEVKTKLKELAESIKLLDSSKKSVKKNKEKTEDVGSDPDFIVSNGVLRKYIGKDVNITIPDGVKEIPDNTFSGYSNLESVLVPEGVKTIGRRCFENCTNLETVSLPDSLEEIGGYAFSDCHNLQEVYLSEKLKLIGDSAFTECFKMKDVIIPKKIKEIEAFAFKNCDAFTHIVVPNGVTTIGVCAFLGCDNLEYLFIPKSVTEFQINFMDNHPFEGCPKLTIYTPKGSEAQKFAVEHGIPYKNADKGIITAQNNKTILESAKSEGTKASGAKAKKTAAKEVPADTENAGETGLSENIVKTFVLMDDYERIEPSKSKSDFAKEHDEYYPKMKKSEIASLYTEVKSSRKRNEFKEECIKSFMDRPVDYRFEHTTKKCFHLSVEEDFRDKRDSALLLTKKWFRPEEEQQVVKLLDDMLASIKQHLLEQIEVGGENWKRFKSAQPDLEIVISDYDKNSYEIPKNCTLFQKANDILDALVTVNLSKGGFLGYTAELGNYMPWFWDVSTLDIWDAALKNEIRDEREFPYGSKGVASIAYLDVVEEVDDPQNEADSFVDDVKDVYDNCTSVEDANKKVEKIINDLNPKAYEFAKVRLRAIRIAKTKNFDFLVDFLENNESVNQVEKELPKAITKDIPTRQAAKILKRAKDDLTDAKLVISRSEKSIKEYEESIGEYQSTLAIKEKELADFEEAKGRELEEDKFRITTNQESQRVVISKLEEKIKVLEKSIEDTQKELDNTSFFKFSVKKELTAKIEELNAKLAEEKDKLPGENSKLYALNAEYNNRVLKHQQEIDKMKKEISDCRSRIKSSNSQIAHLRKLIDQKNEIIPDLENKVKELEESN